MANSNSDLPIAAARYVMGSLPSSELVRIADALLDRGIYSSAVGELATMRHPIMADAGPLFERVLQELHVEMPSWDDAVWILLRHHIGRIAYEDVAPVTVSGWSWTSRIAPISTRSPARMSEIPTGSNS